MTVSISGTDGVTFNDSSVQITAATGFGFKNRIINGAMVISQSAAGASVTINSTTTQFAVDRFQGRGESSDGVFTVQQSSTAPSGFVNSLVATVTTADASIGASQLYFLRQNIEGFNVADFNLGSASAQTFTLSFWVRSSVTGTFGGSVANHNFNRSYPFTYTISTANTFEYKTITIAGDTSGTWATNNTSGLRVIWSLGAGSTFVTTANAWAAGEFYGATGQTNLIATNGATFYITGVQLEKGSTATSFDYRPYGTELALCQRYYQKFGSQFSAGACVGAGIALNSTSSNTYLKYTTPMRAASTTTQSGCVIQYGGGSNTNITGVNAINCGGDSVLVQYAHSGGGPSAGNAVTVIADTTAAFVDFSAEL